MMQVGDPISKTVGLKINGELPEKANRGLTFAFTNKNYHPCHRINLAKPIGFFEVPASTKAF